MKHALCFIHQPVPWEVRAERFCERCSRTGWGRGAYTGYTAPGHPLPHPTPHTELVIWLVSPIGYSTKKELSQKFHCRANLHGSTPDHMMEGIGRLNRICPRTCQHFLVFSVGHPREPAPGCPKVPNSASAYVKQSHALHTTCAHPCTKPWCTYHLWSCRSALLHE